MIFSVLIISPATVSNVLNVFSAISFLSLSHAGWMETRGKHLQYSKLRESLKISKKKKVASKVGMIVLYAPAFLAGLSSFFLFKDQTIVFGDLRFTLLRSAVTLHFFKRVFEVLFVHKYSGWMDLEAMITVSLSYFLFSVIIIYNQYLATQTLSQLDIDLKYAGFLMFFVGISGNFYHHYLLSTLRSGNDEKHYKIPHGGLFSLVICPHYLFEIIGFLGISCISQTLYAILFTMGTTFYLMGRSYATRTWYKSKFEDFPKDVKALFPYIF